MKYFMGWISSKEMSQENWTNMWKQFVLEAEEREMEFVVFEIPKGSDIIQKIEILIELDNK